MVDIRGLGFIADELFVQIAVKTVGDILGTEAVGKQLLEAVTRCLIRDIPLIVKERRRYP